MPFIELSSSQVTTLRDLATESIEYGLTHGCALPVQPLVYADPLQWVRATFVTLSKDNELRGCIGTLVAQDPLVVDVVNHAYAAAFQDPRFPALGAHEMAAITLEISILTMPEHFPVASEADLIRQVEPGVDGLVLASGVCKGTFLPAVWDQLPDPESFIHHLKLKAGLPAQGWPDDIRVLRYQAQKI